MKKYIEGKQDLFFPFTSKSFKLLWRETFGYKQKKNLGFSLRFNVIIGVRKWSLRG